MEGMRMLERLGTPAIIGLSSGFLLACGMSGYGVAAGRPAPELRFVSVAAAVPLLLPVRTWTLPAPAASARRLAEEAQAQPAGEPPLLAPEKHPPPVVNYVPPKPKHGADDAAHKKKSDAKPKEKAKEKVKAKSRRRASRKRSAGSRRPDEAGPRSPASAGRAGWRIRNVRR
jgi:hypothetical protein